MDKKVKLKITLKKSLMKNHPANAGGISVPSKLRLPIRLKVGLEFAFHRLTPVVCAFDVIKNANILATITKFHKNEMSLFISKGDILCNLPSFF
ncbi:MAG: hypothetical protein IKS23_04620 [Alphaproteobacteria bacterium]|nr:hypothetical protein [Alphaproteobacteria bacterium]